jgi:hypothetical protein
MLVRNNKGDMRKVHENEIIVLSSDKRTNDHDTTTVLT